MIILQIIQNFFVGFGRITLYPNIQVVSKYITQGSWIALKAGAKTVHFN